MLRKRDKFAKSFRDETPGLCYLKFGFNGKTLNILNYKSKRLYNLMDIYEMRKDLYRIKDVELATFEDLLGHHLFEYNFGKEDDLYFESNFESGNLCLAIKVNFSNKRRIRMMFIIWK